MISSITGTVQSTDYNKVYLQQGPFTFELFCPQSKKLTAKETINLQTYFHWNQEQGPTLFGFLSSLDKDVFLLIIGCSGIGPKMGLSILEQIEAAQFLQLIIEENTAQLSKLKSIGIKKAEQLCLALRNKAPKLVKAYPELNEKSSISFLSDLQETLESLNYSSTEIKQTMSILKEQSNLKEATFDQLLRKALQILAKK